MIKRIQSDTGARVQFNTSDPPDAPERVCMVSGSAEKVQLAANMIQDLVQSTMERQQGGGNGGGRGRGRGFDQGGGFDDRSPGRGGFGGNFGGNESTQFTVPAEKCGLVIGRGGETIREINRQSGAYVELQRAPASNPNEKIFNVRGESGQIQHAIQMIAEKAGIVSKFYCVEHGVSQINFKMSCNIKIEHLNQNIVCIAINACIGLYI